jgi:small subunit ribosomal protein S6e
MAFKINIGTKSGKTYKLEAEASGIIDKKIGDKIEGKEISKDLEGYEFEIKGGSDKSGFTMMDFVEGIGLKRVLLSYGKGMKRRPKREGKKKISNHKPKGLRLRKTVRGKIISPEIVQINLTVVKEGKESLQEIFEPKTEESAETPKAE